MMRIVSIKFCPAGRHYHFAAGDLALEPGETVVVETARGRSLGIVAAAPAEVSEDQAPPEIKNVLRKASEEDIRAQNNFRSREREAFYFCRRRIEERGMPMKLVRAEYLFDGSKVIFYFTSDGRIDFRELVKDLAHQLHARIEMKQIGVRDEAKLVGGIGICGRELCCCSFLSEFSPVSVKMAKEQGLALNPTKISGQCGRLLCCLSYEFETYVAAKKGFPKIGTRSVVNGKNVLVSDINYLSGRITLRTEDNQTLAVTLDEFDQGQTKPPETPVPPQDESSFPLLPPEPQKTVRTTPGPRPAREGKGQRPPRPDKAPRKEYGPSKNQRPQAPLQGAAPAPAKGSPPPGPPQPSQGKSAPPAGSGEPSKKRRNRSRRKNRPKTDDRNGKK